MIRLRTLAGIAGALLLVAAAPAGSEGDPSSYRLRLAVRPAANAPVQRIALSARVLAALQTPDARDVRVFDANGRALPIARAGALRAAARQTTLEALPILGAPDALTVRGMSLDLDRDGRARVVRVDGTLDARTSGAAVLGMLFDTRALSGEVAAMTLAAALPAGQPVTFTLAASRDLASWRTLGDTVIYRTLQGASGDVKLVVPGARLARDYLRVTWRAGSRLLSPVAVSGATLAMRDPAGETAAMIDTVPPKLADAHLIDLALPFATPLTAIRVVPAGEDLIVPIRVLGRADREQPWTPRGQGIASRAAPARITLGGGGGGAFRLLRIEADRKSGGFTAAPAIALGFAPADIVFAAGTPPFTLAAGRKGSADVYLPLEALAGVAAEALPVAGVAEASDPKIVLMPADDSGATRRQVLLWAVLLLATALLAAMGWILYRGGAGRGGTAP